MRFRTLFDSLKSRSSGISARGTSRRPKASRLHLEALDDRTMPSTFTVTNLLDSGTGSLRAAIAGANTNPGADDIDFATTGTIALTSGELDITDSVTINGPGGSALTVSGNGVSRVFGLAGNPTVYIADLTVANGWTSDSPGGGITMTGTLILDRVTVSGNYAVGDPGVDYGVGGDGLGGGIYVAGGTLTLDQCTVSGNYAVGGAGALNFSTGGDGGQGLGGGLYVAGGTVYVNLSTVSGNYAVGGDGGDGQWYYDDTTGGAGGAAAGGGIRVAAGTVEFYQSTLAANTADGGSTGAGSYTGSPGVGVGGGLDITHGTLTLDQCTVSGNYAVGGDGGGDQYFYNLGYTGGPGAGGGLHVAGGTVKLYQSTLSGNTAHGGRSWVDGVGMGGGLSIAPAAPPLVDLDDFTLSNTVNNVADIDPNISGPYSLNGTRVPSLAISDVSILEGNGGTTAFVFTVGFSAPSGQAVSVHYATADAGATAGSDYQAASGTLTIPVGQTTGTITVLVNGDRLAEPNETFFVNLSTPTNATISDGQGVGTILNDEPRISINDVTVTEGNTGSVNATFTVSLSAAYDAAVTVHYQTANGSATAGSDFQAASGTLTIPAGQTMGTITVLVNGDRLAEQNETFFVNLSSPTNATIADGQGVGTLLDDEPRISISDVTKTEGKKNQTTLFTFTVTLSAAYDQAVTLSYHTTDGTATAGDGDYVGKTGTLTFAPGETTKTITILVNGDSKKEGNETFYLDLSGLSSNGLFTRNRGIGTILNDD